MSITLERAITLYLNDHKPTTRKTYKSSLNPMMQYIGPARPLTSVATDLLMEYTHALKAKNLSPASINTHIRNTRAFFNWCVRIGWIDKSPAIAMKYIKAPKAIDRDKAMTDEHYNQLLDFAKWDPHAYAIVLFFGDTGCRRGAVAKLQWSHINLDDRSALLSEKGDKPHVVFFGAECATAMGTWYKTQKRVDEGNHVFTKNGQPLKNAQNVSAWFRRLCRRASLPEYGPHSVRHRLGFHLGDADVNPNIGAEVFGHSDPSTTMAFYYPKDAQRAREAIERFAHKKEGVSETAKVIQIAKIKRL